MEVSKADFISIQEHFIKSKTIEKYFSQEFQNHSSYIIPGYRESGTDFGRPKGGLAMLSWKNKKVRKSWIKNKFLQTTSSNFRLTKFKTIVD